MRAILIVSILCLVGCIGKFAKVDPADWSHKWTLEQLDAYELGAIDYHDNKSKNDNPYTDGNLRAFWLCAWLSEEADAATLTTRSETEWMGRGHN